MTHVARYGKMVAREGAGQQLADILLTAAGDLADVPGCELYLVNRQADSPDTIWVTELWRSQADLDASLAGLAGNPQVAEAKTLIESAEMIELDLLGGKGPS